MKWTHCFRQGRLGRAEDDDSKIGEHKYCLTYSRCHCCDVAWNDNKKKQPKTVKMLSTGRNVMHPFFLAKVMFLAQRTVFGQLARCKLLFSASRITNAFAHRVDTFGSCRFCLRLRAFKRTCGATRCKNRFTIEFFFSPADLYICPSRSRPR